MGVSDIQNVQCWPVGTSWRSLRTTGLDLSHVRCHIEYKTNDNEAVREIHSLNNGTHCTKVLDHVIFSPFKTVLWNFCLLKVIYESHFAS